MTQIPLLDRVRIRLETDVEDPEVQRLIDEANQEVIRRYGPHADPANPITVRVEGGGTTFTLLRSIDMALTSSVVLNEFRRMDPFGVPVETALVLDTDYRIWHEGRTIERLYSRDSWNTTWGQYQDPGTRFGWGGTMGWAEITYVPVNDGDQRQEVIIKLVQLSLEFDPNTRSRNGNVDTYTGDYSALREKILGTLSPRRGLGFA